MGHCRLGLSTPSNELPTTSAYPYPCRWPVKTWATREIWEHNSSQNGCPDLLCTKIAFNSRFIVQILFLLSKIPRGSDVDVAPVGRFGSPSLASWAFFLRLPVLRPSRSAVPALGCSLGFHPPRQGPPACSSVRKCPSAISALSLPADLLGAVYDQEGVGNRSFLEIGEVGEARLSSGPVFPFALVLGVHIWWY